MVVIDAIAQIPMPMHDFYFQRDLQAFRDVAGQVLNLERYEETTRYRADSGNLVVEVCTVPNIPIPSTLKSMSGLDKIILTDIMEYPAVRPPDGHPYTLGYSLRPPVYQDSLQMVATMEFAEDGPDSCTLHLNGTLDVNIWGWGSMIATIVSGAVADSYSKIPLAVSTWKRRRNWLRLFHQLSTSLAQDGCSGAQAEEVEEDTETSSWVADETKPIYTQAEHKTTSDSVEAAPIPIDIPIDEPATAHPTLHSVNNSRKNTKPSTLVMPDEVAIKIGGSPIDQTTDLKKRSQFPASGIIVVVIVVVLLLIGVASQRQRQQMLTTDHGFLAD